MGGCDGEFLSLDGRCDMLLLLHVNTSPYDNGADSTYKQIKLLSLGAKVSKSVKFG